MVTGPFSILVGYTGGLMALNDRLKLRSMVVGEKDDTVYIASEECAIRVIQPELDKLWAPKGGEPVIVNLKNGGNQYWLSISYIRSMRSSATTTAASTAAPASVSARTKYTFGTPTTTACRRTSPSA